MTGPNEATLERERWKLYVTDAELIRKLGVPEKLARRVIRELDAKPTGFPRKQKLWGNRRYWPAVERYLEASNAMMRDGADRLATENRDRTRLPRQSSLRSHPAEG